MKSGAIVLFLIVFSSFSLLSFSESETSITIGPGPNIGQTMGRTWKEEFQDWTLQDCRGVEAHSDGSNLGDGGDNARDLAAFYFRDDAASGNCFFRTDFFDLYFQAEDSVLDVYILLDLGTPGSGSQNWPDSIPGTPDVRWEVAVCVYSSLYWNIYDQSGTVLSSHDLNSSLFRGAYFNSDLDSMECGIARSILTNNGWDGSSEIRIQAGTSKDMQNILNDALPDVESGYMTSTGSCPTAKFTYVLHGNQALSPANGVQHLIYNTGITTPNGHPTGYRRALESARIFKAPPNIHVSATLLSSLLWADRPGDQDSQDGPEFVEMIAEFLDGNPDNGEGEIVWGVYSEHIMPFFEGEVNRNSIDLNVEYLQDIFGINPPNENSIFWIPERVCRGTTFSDLLATGYNYTILDQINHLREWFGESMDGFKMHNINGVNCFMINDEPDRYKFANTDGGLYIDTRKHLIDIAGSSDQEQVTVVFDDWEAYAGRSFLSFNEGSDNPDNFNLNLRWIANHQWIEILTLEQIAARGWTPVHHAQNDDLPFETYDFLDFATQDSYEHWYQGYDGTAVEEDFDDFYPPIRLDKGTWADKKFGGLKSYGDSTTGATAGSGTIAHDAWDAVKGAPDNSLGKLATLGYVMSIFETAWHDEQDAQRCPDGTYECRTDSTDDAISGFARQLQFLNTRRTGIITAAAAWADSPPGISVLSEASDIDHDGENEYILKNGHIFAVFENDGGRMIAAFARNPYSGEAVSLVGNLIGFPDRDDEWEADFNDNSRRTSAFSDWWAAGPDTNQYVNDIYNVIPLPEGFRLTSSDGKIEKNITLKNGSKTLEVNYVVDESITTLYVRHGLSPDCENLLKTGQRHLALNDNGERLFLTNNATDAGVSLDYSDGSHNAVYNPDASDGTINSPRNQALIHTVELSGNSDFSYGITLDAGGATPTPTPTSTPSPTPTATPTSTTTPSPTPTPTPTPEPTPVSPEKIADYLLGRIEFSSREQMMADVNSDGIVDAADIIIQYTN